MNRDGGMKRGRGRLRQKSAGGARPRSVEESDLLALDAVFRASLSPRPRIRVARGAKLALKLSRDESNLILNCWSVAQGLTDEQLRAVREAELPGLSMTLSDWEEFGGWVAATGNHARSGSRLRSRADRLFDRIEKLLDSHTETDDE